MPITTTPSGGPQGESSTYTPIYSQTFSSNTGSITFSNIPTNFTDLVLVGSVRFNNTNGEAVWMTFNSDTGTNYSRTQLEGYTTPPQSARASNENKLIIYSASNVNYDPYIINIMNYSNPTVFKQVIARVSNIGNPVAFAGSWRSTAQINSITLTMNTSANNFATGTIWTLYGIKSAAPAPKATGGDSINTDGTYWYHTFKTTGLFDVKQPITADILTIAGGGGGANNLGGGGGAGGLLYSASQSLSVTGYPVIVGAGGLGAYGSSGAANGIPGSNSSIAGLTAIGGGAGLVIPPYGTTGGSGGGVRSTSTADRGRGTAGQGNDGGITTTGASSGGGGGAGAVGATSTSNSQGGAGGAGVNTYSSWASVTGTGVSGFYAGGGGGGSYQTGNRASGGSGGGGIGGNYDPTQNGGDGVVNTGSGGGGGTYDYASVTQSRNGAGGSGLVIVRYAV
jgi:hypothetical protein